MEIQYEKPFVIDFGSISEHTFTTPGGNVKGCQTNCKLDKFGEKSAIASP